MSDILIGTSTLSNKNIICCLCGKEPKFHTQEKHRFFRATSKNKCKKCKQWFYQHDHSKNPCFDPEERIIC